MPTTESPKLDASTDEISHSATENELDLRLRLRVRKSLEDAVWAAYKTSFVAPLPLILFGAVHSMMIARDGELIPFDARVRFTLEWVVWTLSFSGLYILVTGIPCGWLAHRFAFETSVPVKGLAIALAWVANLSLWGWMVILAMTGS